MRLALALVVLSVSTGMAADREVYQVTGKLAVVEVATRPGPDGEPLRGATRFRMVLDPEKTLDYRRAEGSEFKPLYDEIVASSRRNVLPGVRGEHGDWEPFLEEEAGAPGDLIRKTLSDDPERLQFFDFQGKLSLRQDHAHPWAEEKSHFVVGELCLEHVAFRDEGWYAPEGACDGVLLPD